MPKIHDSPSPPTQATEDAPQWRLRDVVVACKCGVDGKPSHPVTGALVLGLVAVHPTIGEKDPKDAGLWTVSLLACGQRVARCTSREDAQRIGHFLWTRCRVACQASAKDQALRALPEWTRPWLEACYEAKGWTEPPVEANP